jgi:hypothetical protein
MRMSYFALLRSFFVKGNEFSPTQPLLSRCGYGRTLSKILAVAQSFLLRSEELLSRRAALISILFPSYLPLVYAVVFGCSYLANNAFHASPFFLIWSEQQSSGRQRAEKRASGLSH